MTFGANKSLNRLLAKVADSIIIFNSEALQLENTRPTHDLILIEIIQTMFFEVFK